MPEILTFAQCLQLLMQKHRFTVSDLAAMIGSRADLKHVLAGEASLQKQSRLFDKLKESHLFAKEDYDQLNEAMEITRLGVERYRFQMAVSSILSGQPMLGTQEIYTEDSRTLAERTAAFANAEKLEIICLNCFSHTVSTSLAPLFSDHSRDISMRHYVDLSSAANLAAEYVACAMPLLFDSRYEPFELPASTVGSTSPINGNVLLFRAVVELKIVEAAFLIGGDQVAYELENAEACRMFSFVEKVLTTIRPLPTPLKEEALRNEDFPSLCMTYLSHELNRATYCLMNDLCFQQTPTPIAIDAIREKTLFTDDETERIIERTLSIHEQRYQNQYRKKKPTYRVMTTKGCERFLATGMSTDHFVGFRPFTPEERKTIFGEMLRAARKNSNFVPLLLKEQNFSHRYNLVCYDKLGISLDEKDTNYDLSQGYRSIFLMFPRFIKQYMDYYMEIIVGEKCYSKAESLALLEQMYERFLTENQLDQES